MVPVEMESMGVFFRHFAAAGSVTSEHNDTAEAQLFHYCRCLHRIRHARIKIEVQNLNLAAGHFVILQLVLDAVAHGKGVRHENGFVDPDSVGGENDALADVDLFIVVDGGGIGNKTSDVLAGLGICDDADRRHKDPPL